MIKKPTLEDMDKLLKLIQSNLHMNDDYTDIMFGFGLSGTYCLNIYTRKSGIEDSVVLIREESLSVMYDKILYELEHNDYLN